jgi:hypothetical protein
MNFNVLHYLNTPVVDDDFEGIITIHEDNTTLAFDECKDIMMKSENKMLKIGKSICLRLLMHLIGDVHQPLHAASLYSNMFPKGDKGGSMFVINFEQKKSLNQLHLFWDALAGMYGSIFSPLTEKKFKKLEQIAHRITEDWPRSKVKDSLALTQWDEWLEESHEYAIHFAYDDLKLQSGDKITDEYLETARDVVNHQLAVAGYRLADFLIDMFILL